MALGLGLLRLAPEAFWRMTPRELDAAVAGLIGRAFAPAPLTRAGLEGLMAAYPDEGRAAGDVVGQNEWEGR